MQADVDGEGSAVEQGGEQPERRQVAAEQVVEGLDVLSCAEHPEPVGGTPCAVHRVGAGKGAEPARLSNGREQRAGGPAQVPIQAPGLPSPVLCCRAAG